MVANLSKNSINFNIITVANEAQNTRKINQKWLLIIPNTTVNLSKNTVYLPINSKIFNLKTAPNEAQNTKNTYLETAENITQK